MIRVKQTKDKNYPFLLEGAWDGKIYATEDDLLQLMKTLEKHFEDKAKKEIPLSSNCDEVLRIMRNENKWAVTARSVAEQLGWSRNRVNGCLSMMVKMKIVERQEIDGDKCYRIRPDLLDYL